MDSVSNTLRPKGSLWSSSSNICSHTCTSTWISNRKLFQIQSYVPAVQSESLGQTAENVVWFPRTVCKHKFLHSKSVYSLQYWHLLRLAEATWVYIGCLIHEEDELHTQLTGGTLQSLSVTFVHCHAAHCVTDKQHTCLRGDMHTYIHRNWILILQVWGSLLPIFRWRLHQYISIG